MIHVALKMLVGDRGKYLGIVMGIMFASFLITQQLAIFTGIMSRTYGFISDAGYADIWVMDPKVQFIDDIKPLQDTQLYRVRGVEGVRWAVPLYKGLLKGRLPDGTLQTCNVVGLDDTTLIGGPAVMVKGRLADLRRAEAVIVSEAGAKGKLARPPAEPGGKPVPLDVGDVLEINDHRAIVVGICRSSRTLLSDPVVYTTFSRAMQFAPRERRALSYVLVGTAAGADRGETARRIQEATGLRAISRPAFEDLTVAYFMKYTGIPINFGISVLLGFIIGTAIAGQTFYNFTLENLRHFGALKAMGATNGRLLGMILLQSAVVGAVGYGLGVGAAALFGRATANTELAFKLPWPLLLVTAAAIFFICAIAAILSLRKVMSLEPAIVFKS